MRVTEFDSFMGKFHQLWRAGESAHLDLDCPAGKAWVGIRLQLGHAPDPVERIQPQYSGPARGPAYQRRQERRRAAAVEAATVSEKTDSSENHEDDVAAAEKQDSDVSAEKHLNESSVNESADKAVNDNEKIAAANNEQANKEYSCDLCDFTSNWDNGLNIHMGRMHSRIEQLDGCNDNENEDTKYKHTSHYWKKGYLGTAFQAFLDATDIIEESDLPDVIKKHEQKKVLNARKEALGENFKYFPPWDKK